MAAAEGVPRATDSPVTILWREVDYTFDGQGRLTQRHRSLYRIESEAGVRFWGHVQDSWAPWHEARPELRARVISAAGEEHTLDPASLIASAVAEGDPRMYGDRQLLRAPLPRVGIGAIVEEESLLRETRPYFEAGIQHLYPLALNVPVHRGRVTLELPKEIPLQHRVYGLELTPQEEVHDGHRRLEWRYGDLAAYDEIEPGLPPDRSGTPAVAFATGASWGEVATLYARRVDERLSGEPPVLAALAAGETATTERHETIVALARAIAEQTRYTGLELGEAGIIPASPATTLDRGFGDCKDQATLLVAALRERGITAHLALLNAGAGFDVDPQLPGLGRFDHAIVYAPGEPDVWVDLTDRFVPPGELPVEDQDRFALIARKGGSLVKTPASTAADNRLEEVRRVVMSELGKARMVETTRAWGWPARQLRRLKRLQDAQDRRQALASYVESTLLGTLAEMQETPGSELDGPHILRLEVEESGRAPTEWAQAVVATRRLARQPQERQQLAATAGLRAMFGRRYAVASELFRSASDRAPNAAEALSLASYLAGAVPLEELEPPREKPAQVVFELSRATALDGGDPAVVDRLVHPEAREVPSLRPQVVRRQWRLMAQALSKQSGQVVPILPLVELGLGSTRYTVEGDRQRGYRVEMVSEALGNHVEEQLFLVEEEGRPLLVASNSEPAAVLRQADRWLTGGRLEAAFLWLDWARELLPLTEDEDPFAHLAFSALWPVPGGTPSAVDARIAIAAAAPLDAKLADGALPTLREAIAREEDEDRRRSLRWALVQAAAASEQFDEAATVSGELLDENPDSEALLAAHYGALDAAGKAEELEAWAARRAVAEEGEDPWSHLARAAAAVLRGDLPAAGPDFEQALTGGPADRLILNNWAWYDLFRDPVPESTLERARQAAERSGFADDASLHTLATAYAELQHPLEAHRLLIQTMESRPDLLPQADDWYVLGRIAESYGLEALARRYYERLLDAEEPKVASHGYSTGELARRRLRAMATDG